jgi:GTPase-associated protein 1, N-terminal domain type 1
MAHAMSGKALRLEQALHGYSDGHRLIASSTKLLGRDAKTILMFSDASGSGDSINEDGYLTGYPLTESGYYAFARTWPAPEMPRPGCVWTHTILIEFSDLPNLQSSSSLLAFFRRPTATSEDYARPLEISKSVLSSGFVSSNEESLRRLLSGIYCNPHSCVVGALPAIPSTLERENCVLAIWDQQWPRLRRSFRFCTLSFSDRSSRDTPFDLQLLPTRLRISKTQFGDAFDVDRGAIVGTRWSKAAIEDIAIGPSGRLRAFLRFAGGDISGREAFSPLADLYQLSSEFSSRPEALEEAVVMVDEMLPTSQGRAARAFVAGVAGRSPQQLGPTALDFVLRHWDLLDPTDTERWAGALGQVIWKRNPDTLISLLDDQTARRTIAELAFDQLSISSLISGLERSPNNLESVTSLRPDIVLDPRFWSSDIGPVEDLLNVAFKKTAEREDVVDAIIRSDKIDAEDVCRFVGNELVLRSVVRLIDENEERDGRIERRRWLAEASSNSNVVAKILVDTPFRYIGTLDAISRVISPESVPNQFGDDPWIIAWRRATQVGSAAPISIYLASFLLARGLGQVSRNRGNLICVGFDETYDLTKRSAISEEEWSLLDGRLPKAYSWQSWDRCKRLRLGVVDAFVDKWMDPHLFLQITSDTQLFYELVGIANGSYWGRRYLRHVLKTLAGVAELSRLNTIHDVLDD